MNRSTRTLNRRGRRVRIWLSPETWSRIDRAACELASDQRAPTAIENILEGWAFNQLQRASNAAARFDRLDGTKYQDELRALSHGARSVGAVELADVGDDAATPDDEMPEKDEGPGW